MGWKHVEAGFDLPITHAELLVYLAIARHADNRTNECFPGVQHLIEVTGCNKTYILAIIGRLCKKGYLKKIKKRGRGHPTRYLVVGNKVGLSDLNESDKVGLSDLIESDKVGLSDLKNSMRSDNQNNEVGLSDLTYKDARASYPVIEPVIEEEKDIHTTALDPSTEIPREETPPVDEDKDEDFCVYDDKNIKTPEEEEPEPEADPDPDYSQMGNPDRLCLFPNPMEPCRHTKAALAWVSEQLGYRVPFHPRLHEFLHEYGLSDLQTLYQWHFEHTDREWWHLGNVCGQKAAHNLQLAKSPPDKPANHEPTPGYLRLFDNSDHPDLGEADYVPGCPEHSRLLYGTWDDDQLSYTGCKLCHWQPDMALNPWKEDAP